MIFIAIVLLLVFSISALTKMGRKGKREFQTTIEAFGIDSRLTQFLTVLIPLMELAIALGIVIPRTRNLASLIGIVLLTCFSFLAAWSALRGEHIRCNCFGNFGEDELGWFTVGRNTLLIALLVMLVWSPDLNLETHYYALALSVLINIGLGIAILSVLKEHGGLLSDLGIDSYRQNESDFLPIGSSVPDLPLSEALTGEPITISRLMDDFPKGGVALFVSEHCPACNTVLPHIGSWGEQLAGASGVVVIMQGEEVGDQIKEMALGHPNIRVLNDLGGELSSALGIKGTPSAVTVDREGRVSSNYALGSQSIYSLLQSLV